MIPASILRLVYRLKYRPQPRSVLEDVAYALEVTRGHLMIANKLSIDLSRAGVLEFGPGSSFASQLVLASYGARVAVADPFLARWDRNYHPLFYREFRARWDGPAAAIDAVIEADSYPPEIITCVEQKMERPSALEGQQFDLIISNAVLEHVSDLPLACSALACLTRIGGINSHQIDFRDHLNRAQPLEFLMRSDVGFLLERARHPSQGNRARHSEWIASFEKVGFHIEAADINCLADEDYLGAFLPRLRNSSSRYQQWPAAELRILGSRILLRRVR